MIQINKDNAPNRLEEKRKELTDQLKKEFDLQSEMYLSGKETFKFNEAYKADEIKEALIECQSNKCCFTEAKFCGDYSNVEHFRPKGRVDPYPEGESEYPGYYWLAYEWDNLFLCKSRINSSDKRNFFPLEEDSPRNRTHHDNNDERPILINPSIEDPREHIRFHNEEPFPYNGSRKGKFNIDFFQLRHPEFDNARGERLAFIRTIRDLVDEGLSNGNEVSDYFEPINLLKETMKPDKAFSSMAIDFLKDWPPLKLVEDNAENSTKV